MISGSREGTQNVLGKVQKHDKNEVSLTNSEFIVQPVQHLPLQKTKCIAVIIIDNHGTSENLGGEVGRGLPKEEKYCMWARRLWFYTL